MVGLGRGLRWLRFCEHPLTRPRISDNVFPLRERIIEAMKKIRSFALPMVLAIVLFLGQTASAIDREQTPGSSPKRPARFSDYDFSQYMMSSGYAPQSIIEMDNNGQIILACLAGKTRDELKSAGLSFAESQILLLKTWKLLEEKDGQLKTAFPILDADRTLKLRGRTRTAARSLGSEVQPEIVNLSRQLEAIGRRRSAYTILFSYILDGLVWDIFEQKKLLDARNLTVENPFWVGEVWASYPKRDFYCGTNSISDKGIAFKVNWAEKAIPKMAPFVADWKNFSRMFDDYVKIGRVENEEAKKVFVPFNMFDASGHFTVPVIEETESNPLYQIGLQLARLVADRVPAVLNLGAVTKDFNFRDNKQTLVIAYHELMWDLLDEMEGQNLIRKPLVFLAPEKADPKDVSDLVFIVRAKR
jgi:hypothetical protein